MYNNNNNNNNSNPLFSVPSFTIFAVIYTSAEFLVVSLL